jgi:hypothetical protein
MLNSALLFIYYQYKFFVAVLLYFTQHMSHCTAKNIFSANLVKCSEFRHLFRTKVTYLSKTTILSVALHGCLTLGEEHTLRVLRRIFGPKRDETVGQNEELYNMYS